MTLFETCTLQVGCSCTSCASTPDPFSVSLHIPDDFVEEMEKAKAVVHQVNRDKGFWDGPRNDGEIVALIHAEASEVLEALREPDVPPGHLDPNVFSAVEEELADIILRVLDFAGARHYKIGPAVQAKLLYNLTRPHKHGKKF